jgi:hypothetical protein
MSQLLESVTDVAVESLLGRTKRMVTGFDGVVDVAIERVEDFLGEKRTEAVAADQAAKPPARPPA